MQNLIIVIYYFTPIWAFLIWQYTKIQGKLALLTVEIALLIATIFLAWNPARLPKITNWLHWYTFFLMTYILVFAIKTKLQNLEKVFALGLWMIFIAGDFWEIPVFIYDGFGWLNGWHVWRHTVTEWLSSHIHRAYVFASMILMVKLTKFKFNVKNGLLLFAASFFSFVGLYPWSTYKPLSTLIHVTSLSLFLFITYFGEPQLG